MGNLFSCKDTKEQEEHAEEGKRPEQKEITDTPPQLEGRRREGREEPEADGAVGWALSLGWLPHCRGAPPLGPDGPFLERSQKSGTLCRIL